MLAVMKRCTKCGELKSLEDFYKKKETKDGRRSSCKECFKYADKQYYSKNKEKKKDYQEANKERIAERKKKHYNKNREVMLQRLRESYRKHWEKRKLYREENKEKLSLYSKKYYRTENGKETSRRTYLKRKNTGHKVKFSPPQRRVILERDKYTCQDCGIKVHDKRGEGWNTPDKAHIDHIIPLISGGDSSPKNLQVLCRTCNLTKHSIGAERG